MSDTVVDLIDLQARLRADADGSERTALAEELSSWQESLKRDLDRGLAPAEFDKISSLASAVKAAHEVIDNAWKTYHPTTAA